jgi:DNA-directed RNA polymerase specialized sigma24 family protein
VSSFEALAVVALRRWCADRRQIRDGRISDYTGKGYQPKNSRTHDARIVRVLSFEQVFALLDTDEQTALLVAYRDGLSLSAAANVTRSRAPVAQACLSKARLRLANLLDARDLL